MNPSTEGRLINQGALIREVHLGPTDPALEGCLLVRETDAGSEVNVVIRLDLEKDRRAMYLEWAEQRVDRLLEHGPEPDGWKRNGEGDWQLWARRVLLPSLE